MKIKHLRTSTHISDVNNCKRIILQNVTSPQELLSNPRVHRSHLIAYMDKNSITYVKSAKKPELIGKIKKYWDSLASKVGLLPVAKNTYNKKQYLVFDMYLFRFFYYYFLFKNETLAGSFPHGGAATESNPTSRGRRQGRGLTRGKSQGETVTQDKPNGESVLGDSPQKRTVTGDDNRQGRTVAGSDPQGVDLLATDLAGVQRTGEVGQASTDFNININLISSTKVLERYYVD